VDVPWVRRAAERCVERWRDAKKPAQFLAAAYALVDAAEGRPVHLPVRVDATCSGVQHLALVLRDENAAKLVNLWGPAKLDDVELVESDPKPDFYGAVATTVQGLTEGNKRAEAKSVIVPLLYGAGLKKGTLARKLAVERRGEEARVHKKDRRDARAIRAAARKVAPDEFALLDWFGKVARAHNGVGPLRRVTDGKWVCWVTPDGAWYSKLTPTGIPVRWYTPSRFEVIQDYRRVKKDKRLQLKVNGRRANLVMEVYTEQLDKRHSASAIKANVVHSLDAALLVEIVAGSSIDRWGVAHDAFAVPPGRVWDLLQANRHAIRALYTSDRLAEWTAAWRARGVNVPDPPKHAAELPREMWSDRRTLS
jgi:DNA-directed RNA polymerase